MWETLEGIVCLRDVFLSGSVENAAVCVRLGASAIMQIHVDSRFRGNRLFVCVAFFQQDGNIHRLHFSCEKGVSIVEPLVLAGEGRLVHIGGILTTEIPMMHLGNKAKKLLHVTGSDGADQALLSVDFGLVQSLPVDRDVLCAEWVSSDVLALGLSQGDLLLVHMQPAPSESGLVVGKQLRLREQLLKDRGGGFKALWSDFLGQKADANCDTIAIGSLSTTALAVNRSGELRVWNPRSRQLVAHAFLYDLLEAVGEVAAVVPRSSPHLPSAAAASEQEVDRNIHLQDCIVRLAGDREGEGEGEGYALAVLAVLPEQAAARAGSNADTVSAAAAAAAGGAWGLVPESVVPMGQQVWQVLLATWKGDSASNSSADKPRLVSQPLRFPLNSTVNDDVCRQEGLEQGKHVYRYSAASLQDVQLQVDEGRGVVTIVTVWRAEATRTSVVAGEEEVAGVAGGRVVLGSLVGRSEVSLGAVRARAAQSLTGDGSLPAAGSLEELEAPSAMVLVAHSAALDRLRLGAEDTALHHLRAEKWVSSAPSEDFLSMEEKKLKSEMLQRIFLRRRFSKRVICLVHDSFANKVRADGTAGAGNSVDWQEADAMDTAAPHHHSGGHHFLLDQRTPLTDLPGLVLELCQLAASAKSDGGGADLLCPAGGAAREVRKKMLYLQSLQDTFASFIAECEALTTKFDRVNAGCLASAESGEVAVAHRCGELGLIRTSQVVTAPGAVLSGSGPQRQADMLLRQVEALHASDSALSSSFVELDCLMASYLQEGDLSPAGLLWVEQYCSALSLSPGLRGLLPALVNTIQPVVSSRSGGDSTTFSSLDCLVAGDAQALCDFAVHAFQRLGLSGEKEEGSTSAVAASSVPAHTASLLVQEVCILARQRLHRTKLVLCLLFLLRDVGQPLLSRDSYVAVRDVYIPQVTHSLVHLSLILWLDTRLAFDNRMLRHDVELANMLPLSAVASLENRNNTSFSVDSAATQPDFNLSVLENFVQHHCTRHGSVSAQALFPALLPSVHSGVAVYLFQSGQYVSLGRWAAVAGLSATAGVRSGGDCETMWSALDRVLAVASGMRNHLTQLTCEYLELLRCQWRSLQCDGGRSEALLAAIHAKGTELLQTTQELGLLANDLSDETLFSADSTGCTPIGSPQRIRNEQQGSNSGGSMYFGRGIDVGADLAAHLHSLWQTTAAGLSRSDVTAIELSGVSARLDGLLALSDATIFLGKATVNSPFVNTLFGGDSTSSNSQVLLAQPSELCTALHLSGLSCVLEIIDRSLPLLPKEEGAALALHGALLQVEQITNSMELLSQRSNTAGRAACSQALVVELHGAWSRVFEYALWHGKRYNEALEALLRVAELEEQRFVLSTGSLPATGVTWRDCLRTLVAQACEWGQLGWLCSIPDRQFLGYGRRGLSLSEAVATTLEVLATTLETPGRIQSSSCQQEVNYFECLYVYQLNRRNYHDAARVMHQFLLRSRETTSSSQGADGSGCVAAALTSLSVLPADQAFLLHRANASGSSSGSSSSVRQVDAGLLSLALVQELAAFTLRSSNSSSGRRVDHSALSTTSSSEAKVLALSNAGQLHAALSLAAEVDRGADGKPAAGSLLSDVPLISLAKLCVAPPSDGRDVALCRLHTDAFLLAPYALPCSPPSTVAASTGVSKDSDDACWQLLSQLLRCVGRSGGEQKNHQYGTAVRALLAFHANDRADGAPTQLQLPRGLVDAFSTSVQQLHHVAHAALGASQPGSDDSSGGDPSALIRLFLEFGNLEDACLLASRLIRDCNASLRSSPPPPVSSKMFLPYTLIDQLIDHCHRQLPRLELSALEQHARLSAAFNALNSNLQQHFALLILT